MVTLKHGRDRLQPLYLKLVDTIEKDRCHRFKLKNREFGKKYALLSLGEYFTQLGGSTNLIMVARIIGEIGEEKIRHITFNVIYDRNVSGWIAIDELGVAQQIDDEFEDTYH